jgi:hypothetical protein
VKGLATCIRTELQPVGLNIQRAAGPSLKTPPPVLISLPPQLVLVIMATFAPPVQRDRFLYSSVLYADAGNDNRHPRASVAELTALLRPEAPKRKGTKTAAVAESATDRPWHFWTAQLIHYGLTSTKNKNAAKI